MIEHIEDHAKLYEAARSLRKSGMPLSWRADEISAVLDELIRLRHIVASGLAVSINQENKDLRFEVERLKAEIDRVKALNHQQFGDAIRKNAEVDRLKTRLETVRCLLGASVPSDELLDIAIDAAIRNGERP